MQAETVKTVSTWPARTSLRVEAALARFEHLLIRRGGLCAIVLFFLLVTSIRLFFLHLYGSDLAYSDQWDSEGWNWLKPYQEGSVNWSVLFLPHNEHRIVFVRLLSLALFALNNGQWDNFVSATFDVLLVATMCTLALRALIAHLGHEKWVLSLFLLMACCLPCGFENLLSGFQVQIYLLLAFTVLGVWLAASRAPDIRTTLGVGTLAALTLFTMASGLFTAVAIGTALALRLWTTRSPWRGYVPLFALLLAALIGGYLLLVRVPNHQALHAQDVTDWLHALRLAGSWPLPSSWIAFAIVWLPFAVGSVALVRQRQIDAPGTAAIALGVWTALQISSVAYGRARDLVEVHSRYTDMLALTILVNAFFCMRLMQHRFARTRPNTSLALAGLWLALLVGAYAAQGAAGFVAMQQFGLSRQVQNDGVRRYVQGGYASVIDTAMPWNLPYPDKQRLKMMLSDKTIRDILPASARPQLAVGAFSGGFSINGMPAAVPRPQGRLGAYGSYAPGTGNENTADMTSIGMHSRFPYLRFAVAGFAGTKDLAMSVDSDDGTTSHPVAPKVSAGETWATVTVATPSTNFVVHARDNDRAAWFAFAAPVEIGRLSLWTEWLLQASQMLLFAVILALYFLVQLFWLRRLQPASDQAIAVAELPSAAERVERS